MIPLRRHVVAWVGLAAFITVGSLFGADTVVAPAPSPQPVALVGALIRTQTDAGDFVGTIIVKDGKIIAMGPNVRVLADTQTINLTNHVITPGLIDARSVLWLNGPGARESGNNGGLNILDAVDPFADDWRDAARQGVTAVYVQPGSGSNLGGNGAILRVGPTQTTEELVIRSPAGVQATIGAAAPAAPQQQNDQLSELLARLGIQRPPQQQAPAPATSNSLTRYAQYEAFRGLFDAAKKYGENKPATKDIGKELLQRALKREIPVRLETAHEDDLRNALNLTGDFGIQLVFDRLDRLKSVPEELSSRKDGIVIGPLMGGKKSAEIRKLALDGRRFAIATQSEEPRGTAWLRAHASAAVGDGYPRERVLRAMTREAAEMHGVADKLGSLAEGRVADLVVFAGDPLDPSVPVRMTISQGVVTYDAPKIEAVPAVVMAKSNLPDPLPATYVIKTSRLLNETGEFAPGELFIEGGKVANPAARNSAAPVFDVGDAPVTPGLVAANVVLGNETSPDADAGHLRAADGLATDDAKMRGYRDAGFLTTVVSPASTNVITGLASAVRTGESGLMNDCGMKFVLTSSARNNDRYPASLVGQIELIGDRLRGAPSKTELYLPASIRKSLFALREQNLGDVRNGKAPAIFEAQSRVEIQAALRLIAEHKLRGTIVYPKQVDELVNDIRSAGVGVVIGPMRSQDTEKTRAGLVELGRSNTPMAFGGEASELRTTAAWLVNGGLPRSAARRALVAHGGERFGLPVGSGRLSSGDAADFVIWDGDPVDPAVRPTAVIAQGQRVGKGS